MEVLTFFFLFLVFGLLCLPIAFFSNIVKVPSHVTVQGVLSTWISDFISVAIPQELMFRGVLLNMLLKTTNKSYVLSLTGMLISPMSFSLLSSVLSPHSLLFV